jgi:ribosome recycling factor
VKKYAEEARVGVRNIRRDSNENYRKLEKDSVISEDEMHDYLDEVQKVTDEFIEQINDLMKAKEEEVMAVN